MTYQSCCPVLVLRGRYHSQHDKYQAGNLRVVQEAEEPGNRECREDNCFGYRDGQRGGWMFALVVAEQASKSDGESHQTQHWSQAQHGQVAFEQKDPLEN